ncbi:MAG TPA: UxaA family hydrolase [archaeon]|nr:UxaA family hydrolase [archaeon]
MQLSFLLHHESDNVGVAVVDIAAGSDVLGRYRDKPEEMHILVVESVPLGHKLATRSISSGEDIIEYGVAIGLATKDIAIGQAVHVHNLKGKRWY